MVACFIITKPSELNSLSRLLPPRLYLFFGDERSSSATATAQLHRAPLDPRLPQQQQRLSLSPSGAPIFVVLGTRSTEVAGYALSPGRPALVLDSSAVCYLREAMEKRGKGTREAPNTPCFVKKLYEVSESRPPLSALITRR